MSLYLWINIVSVSIPLLASFHPRIKLYRHWSKLFLTMMLVAMPFIVWDIIFTHRGIWGFEESYLVGINLLGLPMEEWLFFICIPYACVFSHIAILELLGELRLTDALTKSITSLLTTLCVVLFFLNLDLAYTTWVMIFTICSLGLAHFAKSAVLSSYYLTFLFMLCPFFIVDGILTGAGIADQVVWYNDDENLGKRLGTIPVEDVFYAFALILFNLLGYEYLTERLSRDSDI